MCVYPRTRNWPPQACGGQRITLWSSCLSPLKRVLEIQLRWFYLSILNCIRGTEAELSGLHGSAQSDTRARVSITKLSFGECLLVDSSLYDNPGCPKNSNLSSYPGVKITGLNHHPPLALICFRWTCDTRPLRILTVGGMRMEGKTGISELSEWGEGRCYFFFLKQHQQLNHNGIPFAKG